MLIKLLKKIIITNKGLKMFLEKLAFNPDFDGDYINMSHKKLLLTE